MKNLDYLLDLLCTEKIPVFDDFSDDKLPEIVSSPDIIRDTDELRAEINDYDQQALRRALQVGRHSCISRETSTDLFAFAESLGTATTSPRELNFLV